MSHDSNRADYYKTVADRRYQYICKLIERNRELEFALQVINDCLFGNTNGDKYLEEAYQTATDILAKK